MAASAALVGCLAKRGPSVVKKSHGSEITPSPFLLHRKCEHLNVLDSEARNCPLHVSPSAPRSALARSRRGIASGKTHDYP